MSNTVEVRVPDIGDFSEVPVVEVLVNAGDTVADGDTLIVLESDKSTLEVPAESAGKIVSIAVAVDDVISEGGLILTMEVADAATMPEAESAAAVGIVTTTETAAHTTTHQTSAGSTQTAIAATDMGNPDTGRQARTTEPESGVHKDQRHSVDDTAEDNANRSHRHDVIYASPSIRRYARQLGATIDEIDGTGPKQRITREDVERYVKGRLTSDHKHSAAGINGIAGLPDWPEIDYEKFGSVERQPLSRITKLSGPALTRNAIVIPHVTHFDKSDITELEAFRQALNTEATSDDAKITLLTFAVKAAVAALKTYPVFNSSLDGEELVIKQYWNIGIAVDTPDGLLVPVIKAADQKGFREIANEMATLAANAREGKLPPADMQGATFSISSLGGIGGTNFTPIINAPEVAILGIPRSEMQPVWDGEQFAPRLIQPLNVSFDHRVIDGVAAARFLAHIAASLNDLRRINM
jgi:pyruvate dehydrogenase E2 component (dihydrolipoamide acetyltransferase)